MVRVAIVGRCDGERWGGIAAPWLGSAQGPGKAHKAPQLFNVGSAARAVGADASRESGDALGEIGLRFGFGKPVGVDRFEVGHGLALRFVTL